jgi:hypothetical protein
MKILFLVFNSLFVGYSLAKNNLNSTYQYNMIPKNISKNYLKFKVSREVSRFLCRSVYYSIRQKKKEKETPITYTK